MAKRLKNAFGQEFFRQSYPRRRRQGLRCNNGTSARAQSGKQSLYDKFARARLSKRRACGGIFRKDTVALKRRLDLKIVELNSQGFLNGHTPFSAIVAFSALFLRDRRAKKDTLFCQTRAAQTTFTSKVRRSITNIRRALNSKMTFACL